jgi:predicted transcriptional regulator
VDDNESTKKTLTHINEHPGIRYRQLFRLSGLANGALSFHLKKLKKSKLVKAKKLGYNTIRYYPIAVKTTESDILDHLLDSTRRKIIFFLLEHSNSRFKEILHHIGRAPSTISVQLQRLKHWCHLGMVLFVLRYQISPQSALNNGISLPMNQKNFVLLKHQNTMS